LIERIGVAGIKVLLILFKSGKMYIREIIREAGVGYTSIYRALHDMSELKLIDEEISEGKRFIMLTEKGKKVAEKLLEIEELLKTGSKYS